MFFVMKSGIELRLDEEDECFNGALSIDKLERKQNDIGRFEIFDLKKHAELWYGRTSRTLLPEQTLSDDNLANSQTMQ